MCKLCLSVSAVGEDPNYNFHITSKGNQTFFSEYFKHCACKIYA